MSSETGGKLRMSASGLNFLRTIVQKQLISSGLYTSGLGIRRMCDYHSGDVNYARI